MRLVEFLILILQTHADTLQRLAAIFGEEVLIEMLEASGEEPEPAVSTEKIWQAWPAREESRDAKGSAYAELEGAIADLRLPAQLEFYLWTYPHYRAFIESPLDLNSRIHGPGGDAGLALVEEAVQQAQDWIHKLPIPPTLAAQAERAAHVAWLRFRTLVLKKIGKRPLGPVY